MQQQDLAAPEATAELPAHPLMQLAPAERLKHIEAQVGYLLIPAAQNQASNLLLPHVMS